MTSIALNTKYPSFFAASVLMARQWDPAQVASLNVITEVLEQNGAKMTRAVWNSRANAEEFEATVEAMLEDGPDSNVRDDLCRQGSAIPERISANGGAGHVWT